MKKLLCSIVLCGMAALPAIAQGGGGGAQTPPAAPPTDPISTFVKGAFKQISTNLIGSVEQMPEENFSMKIGTTPEVRTFGSDDRARCKCQLFLLRHGQGRGRSADSRLRKNPADESSIGGRDARGA